MAHNQLLFRSEAREKILRGAAALTDAVRVTLGPKSKSVLIQSSYGPPAGIIDPTKVVRVALQNAISVASVLLLTEATMTDLPDPQQAAVNMPAEPPMMM